MLALSFHTISNLDLSTIIFDEIDTGVSGEVANRIGEVLKEISFNTQVIAITHSPLVAS